MEIEITNVDASEKKLDNREYRPTEQYSREYSGSFTQELPKTRDQPATYQQSEQTKWEHSYEQSLKEREKNQAASSQNNLPSYNHPQNEHERESNYLNSQYHTRQAS